MTRIAAPLWVEGDFDGGGETAGSDEFIATSKLGGSGRRVAQFSHWVVFASLRSSHVGHDHVCVAVIRTGIGKANLPIRMRIRKR